MELRVEDEQRYEDAIAARQQHRVRTDPAAAWEQARDDARPVLSVLSAPEWCYWCRVHESERSLFAPAVWEHVRETHVPLLIDTGTHPELFAVLGDGGWPTTASFDPDGGLRDRFGGPRRPERFLDWLDGLPEAGTPIDHVPPQRPFDERLRAAMDRTYGGFGTGGKTVRPGLLLDRLAHGETGFVERTIDLLRTGELDRYRMTDPVAGGVHRYTETRDWSQPHYEKRIADTAGLVAVLEALGQDTDVHRGFLERMRLDGDGFAAAEGPYRLEEYFGSEQRDGEPYRDERPLPLPNARAGRFLLEAAAVSGMEEYMELAAGALERAADRDHGIMAAAWIGMARRRGQELGTELPRPDPRPLEPQGFAIEEMGAWFGPERSVLGRGDGVMTGDLSRDIMLGRDGPFRLS